MVVQVSIFNLGGEEDNEESKVEPLILPQSLQKPGQDLIAQKNSGNRT